MYQLPILITILFKLMSLYEVDFILDKRYNINTGTSEYKVKWKGYSELDATWEPIQNLEYVAFLVEQFNRNYQRSSSNSSSSSSQQSLIEYKAENVKFDAQRMISQDNQPSLLSQVKEKSIQSKSIKQRQQAGKRGRGRPRKTKQIKEQTLQKLVKGFQSEANNENNNFFLQTFPNIAPNPSQQIAQYPKYNFVGHNRQNLRYEDDNISIKSGFSEGDFQCAAESSDYSVLEMARHGAVFLYLVMDRQQLRWVTKKELMRGHLQALIDFYQSHIEIQVNQLHQNTKRR